MRKQHTAVHPTFTVVNTGSPATAKQPKITDRCDQKALSGLGFSGDIFMGLYDNLEYRQKNKAEFDLKNASESAEDAARLRQSLTIN